MGLGTDSAPGYFEWHKPGPARIAYMGWNDGGANNLGLFLENGAAFSILGGSVSMGSTLNVAGPVTMGSAVSVGSTLVLVGPVIVSSPVVISGGVAVGSDVSIGGKLGIGPGADIYPVHVESNVGGISAFLGLLYSVFLYPNSRIVASRTLSVPPTPARTWRSSNASKSPTIG